MATTTVKTVQDIFQCQLALFSNSANGRSKIAAWGSYTIPDDIADLVEMVSGKMWRYNISYVAIWVKCNPSPFIDVRADNITVKSFGRC